MPRIPDLPGNLVPSNSEQHVWLKNSVAAICKLNSGKFPGSQPISFGISHIQRLENDDYWVCEKSDGVRVLLFVYTVSESDQSIYLIDRHNNYRQVDGFFFPHHEHPKMPLRNSIIDGELVLDVDPRTKRETLNFLCFDCLVIDDQNVMTRWLDKRYGRLKEWFYRPYQKMLREFPQVAATHPFQISVKETSLSYTLDQVFQSIPNLRHGNDGLIYTRVSTPYMPGTDQNILKWKPPSENSIDFKLVLKFPPSSTHPEQPDYHAKPIFALHVWTGGEGAGAKYDPYDVMQIENEDWEEMKASGEQFDDRIVEVHWDSSAECWRLMRFRDDKPHGNYRGVVENIISSIRDGVEKEVLLERCTTIRNAWKARHGQPPTAAPSNTAPRQSGAPPVAPQPPPLRVASVEAEIRYGPIAVSKWSKVSGPDKWAGMYR